MPRDLIAACIVSASQGRHVGGVRLENVELACVEGYRVAYTGSVLRQEHSDMLSALLALLGGAAEGSRATVELRDIGLLLGQKAGAYNREVAWRMLGELIATCVHVCAPDGFEYMGSLVPGGSRSGPEAPFELDVNRALVDLVLRDVSTLRVEELRALNRRPLAHWLARHLVALPGAISVAELQRLTASPGPTKRFRQRVREALATLEQHGLGRWALTASDTVTRVGSARAS